MNHFSLIKKASIFFVLGFCFMLTQAQQQIPIQKCGYDFLIDHKKKSDPEFMVRYEGIFRSWKNAGTSRDGEGVYTLPVVFHVVFHNESQNIPDSVIYSQLAVLNEDYRRQNADTINTRDIFRPVAADCEISFSLAQTDPYGNATTGITRTYTNRTGFSFDLFSVVNTLDEVKKIATGGVDAWDTEHYINVWICNIEAGSFGQVFGISYPPANVPHWPAGAAAPQAALDGIIIHYTTVGRNNPVAGEDQFDGNEKGRTLTHEMGHYLGLRHTWGDAIPFFEDGCTMDDGIEDTPNTATGDQFQCNVESNSCESSLPDDLPDMIENYMDYTPDECLNMFTLGQRDLMRYVVEEFRPHLLDGVGITPITGPDVLSVFPNPASDQISLLGLNTVGGSYEIRDYAGRIVGSGVVNRKNAVVSIAAFQQGLYFFRSGTQVCRFIKMNK